MQNNPRRLKQLEKLLCSLPEDGDPMILSELDGFLAGILVCPELIMPGEWLPAVWGGEAGEGVPIFESVKQSEKLVELVMAHYHSIAGALHSGRGHYAPVFDIDIQHDEILWEVWIAGFERAMKLRPESWVSVIDADEDTRKALAGLVRLGEIDRRESQLPEEQIELLTNNAHELIPHWVELLNAWRIRRAVADHSGVPAHPFGKVGRNEPCPCGSGKKYKKCCALT